MNMVKCSFSMTNFLLCIFKCKWDGGNEHLLIKISNKKHLLQCNIEYNDETIKCRMANILNCREIFYKFESRRKQRSLEAEAINF